MLHKSQLPPQSQLQADITNDYLLDEKLAVERLINNYPCTMVQEKQVHKLAEELISHIADQESDAGGMEAFMRHYDLSSKEGVMMMCLAEALLRIPDSETESLLVEDKLTSANWDVHLGLSHSSFVNATTWGLALTGKVLDVSANGSFKSIWKKLIKRSGDPVIRQAVRAAIALLSKHFVLGRTIEEALKSSKPAHKNGYHFSYDMLGEAAITAEDAALYFEKYLKAIHKVGSAASKNDHLQQRSSVSIKLSALYPRYEWAKRTDAIAELTLQLKKLAQVAQQYNIPITVDAEETDRLEMSLDIFENVYLDADLNNWSGLGLAVQAYQKRSLSVIAWLADLAKRGGKTIGVRLVKGAYWDTEIKQAQMKGLIDYPVYTRKPTTDLSYIICASKLLQAAPDIYPQFATHNACTAATILVLAKEYKVKYFEFQALQGMGQSLHDHVMSIEENSVSCRIYAPVGIHEDLLPYLVRRLLENGANSSFVNQISKKDVDLRELSENVIKQVMLYHENPRNCHIPLPRAIFKPERTNAKGVEISDRQEMSLLHMEMKAFESTVWGTQTDSAVAVRNPGCLTDVVGWVNYAQVNEVSIAVEKSQQAFASWSKQDVTVRANALNVLADLIEEHQAELFVLLMREAGKTLIDAIAELREAVDFCRYYSVQAEQIMQPQLLRGYTGESNTLQLVGRGPFVCISPWNFPLAIFIGQIAAALVVGNTVLAKPAEQTPLVALKTIELFHQAGVPKDVLQLLIGPGDTVGATLIQQPLIAGVMFTGSNQTSRHIQRSLADRDGPIIPFVAETGGLNAMLVDSTALPEQTIKDVVESAFGSAGQRCSACRILLLQDDVADNFISMLQGAMAELHVDDPKWLSTDIGPIIDEEAKSKLVAYAENLSIKHKLIYKTACPDDSKGTFIGAQAYELDDLSEITEEMFGPILHVVRFKRKKMLDTIEQLNSLGYGLTFGIQSRIDNTVCAVIDRVHAGNIYVNRNMIGAIVGLQPFGGMGLSGSGPKAGGPNYLPRLCHEVTVSVDTTAAGGNASLMALDDDQREE